MGYCLRLICEILRLKLSYLVIKRTKLKTAKSGNLLTLLISHQMMTNNLVRSIVRRIKRFADGIVTNKNVSTCRKIWWYL